MQKPTNLISLFTSISNILHNFVLENRGLYMNRELSRIIHNMVTIVVVVTCSVFAYNNIYIEQNNYQLSNVTFESITAANDINAESLNNSNDILINKARRTKAFCEKTNYYPITRITTTTNMVVEFYCEKILRSPRILRNLLCIYRI